VSVDWLLTGRLPKRLSASKTGVAPHHIPIVHWGDISDPTQPLQVQLKRAEVLDFLLLPDARNMSEQAFALEMWQVDHFADESMIDPNGVANVDLPA
jgi:hypothetical protein